MKWMFTFLLITAAPAAKTQTVVLVDSMPVKGKQPNLYSSSTIISQNKNGTVYALPKDRMPALRPDTTAVYHMPVHTFKARPYTFNYSTPPKKTAPQKFSPNSQLKDTILLQPKKQK
jgi:hypothetical protein